MTREQKGIKSFWLGVLKNHKRIPDALVDAFKLEVERWKLKYE